MAKSKKIQTASPAAVEVLASPLGSILTVEECAARLKVPVTSIYEMTRFRSTHSGRPALPYRKVGRYLRFIAAEVDAWLLGSPLETKTKKRQYKAAA
jgi:excisionase family DNA binding protein